MILSSINWGNDSAESDATLLDYFVESSSYTRLINGQKKVVIGRKGSGKSALKKKLENALSSLPNVIVLNISPTFNMLRTILNDHDLATGFGEEIFFQHTWLRNIYTECLCEYGHSAKGTLTTGSAEFAREISNKRSRSSSDFVEGISNTIKRVRAKVGALGEFGLALERELREAAEIDGLEHHVRELGEKGVRFIILVDDLDLGWNNSKIANNLVLGLLAAVTAVSAVIPNIQPYIFLREDVYNIILTQTQHADKYRDVERIRWEKEQLLNILKQRIAYNRAQNKLPAIDDVFASVFPPTVSTSNTDNWLVDHTLSRPRELIQLAKYYTEQIEDENPSSEKLKSSEVSYSTWKLQDLCSEFMHQYPGLNSIFSYWTTKLGRLKHTLSRGEIDEKLLEILTNVELNEMWFNDLVANTDVNKFIGILYEIGFIGDRISGGSGGGSKTYYTYEGHTTPRFEEVQIHPCFRKAVNTVERIRADRAVA